MNTNANDSGFTLIEVMIASLLLSFEIMAVLAMFSFSAKSNAFSRHLTGAGSLAQGQIEIAKNTAYSNLPDLGKVAGVITPECFDRDLQSRACDGTETYTRVTTVEVKNHLTQVEVPGMSWVFAAVTWNDSKGKSHGTTLVTSVSRF